MEQTPVDEDGGTALSAPLRSHREIARMLGIGRARVFFHEDRALTRIRAALDYAGVSGLDELLNASPGAFGRVIRFLKENTPVTVASQPFSPQHGWLAVDRVVSTNGGTENAMDIKLAYQFFKERHETLFRPPVLVSSANGYTTKYVVQAVDASNNSLRVRCWPAKDGVPRTVGDLTDLHCVALVESEFGSDESGDFDIPLLICLVVSHRGPSSQSNNNADG